MIKDGIISVRPGDNMDVLTATRVHLATVLKAMGGSIAIDGVAMLGLPDSFDIAIARLDDGTILYHLNEAPEGQGESNADSV